MPASVSSVFVDVIAKMDIIDLADRIIGDVLYGPPHRFHVPRRTVSGRTIDQLLSRHGIRVWGRGFTTDCICFNVKQKQAEWAEYCLRRYGVPIAGKPVNPRNEEYARKYAPGSEPPSWQQWPKAKQTAKHDRMSSLIDWFRM